MILNKEVMKNSSKQSVRFDNLFWRVFFGVPNSQVFATHCKIRYFLHERFLNGSSRQKWIFLLLERQGICKLFEIVLLWVLITPNCVFWYSTLVFVPLDLWRQQFLSLVTRSLLHFLLCYWKRETNGFLFGFTFVQSLKPALKVFFLTNWNNIGNRKRTKVWIRLRFQKWLDNTLMSKTSTKRPKLRVAVVKFHQWSVLLTLFEIFIFCPKIQL